MQKRHFEYAALLVRQILNGTSLDGSKYCNVEVTEYDGGNLNVNIVRATWVASAFIEVFRAHNSLFDEQRFLVACGLRELEPKKRMAKAHPRRKE